MPIALEAKNLVKQYPGVLAVDGVSFNVEEGICFGLLGPNGAGKTTTVEIMEGVTPATSGEVHYYGKPAGSKFREEAGVQFQSTALQQFITVKETLEMFRNLYDRQADLDQVIDDCSLRDLLDRDNRKLSGGQLQRLLLGIALVNNPRIVFLDEPTTGLDPQARRNFWDLISRIRSGGTTIILTTHYMEEAQFLCDQIAIMDVGKILRRVHRKNCLRNITRMSSSNYQSMNLTVIWTASSIGRSRHRASSKSKPTMSAEACKSWQHGPAD